MVHLSIGRLSKKGVHEFKAPTHPILPRKEEAKDLLVPVTPLSPPPPPDALPLKIVGAWVFYNGGGAEQDPLRVLPADGPARWFLLSCFWVWVPHLCLSLETVFRRKPPTIALSAVADMTINVCKLVAHT